MPKINTQPKITNINPHAEALASLRKELASLQKEFASTVKSALNGAKGTLGPIKNRHISALSSAVEIAEEINETFNRINDLANPS